MKRTEYELETKAAKIQTAFGRFEKKFPEAFAVWGETFEYMAENGIEFFADTVLANGEFNQEWCYALHLDVYDNNIYMCVIERA